MLPQVAAAEGNDIAPQVDDGKDGAVAENIVNAALLALIRQMRRHQLFPGVAHLPHGSRQAVPALAGIADAKPGDGRFGQPPPDEIGSAGSTRFAHQVAVEIPGGVPVQL